METEIPLAIYELESLPDKNGKMHSIVDLKKRRHLMNEVHPVLYVRATKSNFRVLDPIRMDQDEKFRSHIAPLFSHILSEHRQLNDPDATMQDYLEWLFGKMFATEARLALAGVSHGGEIWSDFGRNWSVF